MSKADTPGGSPGGDLIRAINLRDLGGYRTADGAIVRHGKVYRSATLSGLEGASLGAVRALGIRTIVDLRHNSERAAHPTPWEALGCATYWCRDHLHSGADLGLLLRDPALTAEACRTTMLGLYRALPYDQHEAYQWMFRCLIDGGAPLLFHCAAGKDRTGVAAALILAALGVSRGAIAADYSLTAGYDLFGSPPVRDRPPMTGARYAIVEPLLVPETTYLEAMFDSLIQRSGSVQGYLSNTLALSQSNLVKLRDTLLDTPE